MPGGIAGFQNQFEVAIPSQEGSTPSFSANTQYCKLPQYNRYLEYLTQRLCPNNFIQCIRCPAVVCLQTMRGLISTWPCGDIRSIVAIAPARGMCWCAPFRSGRLHRDPPLHPIAVIVEQSADRQWSDRFGWQHRCRLAVDHTCLIGSGFQHIFGSNHLTVM